jgi:hypothetical protein
VKDLHSEHPAIPISGPRISLGGLRSAARILTLMHGNIRMQGMDMPKTIGFNTKMVK